MSPRAQMRIREVTFFVLKLPILVLSPVCRLFSVAIVQKDSKRNSELSTRRR